MKISVIIPTHDRPASLIRAVRSVLGQGRRADELIVVNDAQADIPAQIAQEASAAGVKFIYVRSDRPSLTTSRNRGIRASGGDILLMIDDDVTLPEDFLERLERLYTLDSQGVVGGIGGLQVDANATAFRRRLWDGLAWAAGDGRWRPRRVASRYVVLPAQLRGQLVPARQFTGGVMSFRRGVAVENPFDEWFSGYAFSEDREYSYRVGQREALFLSPSLRAAHESAPGGRGDMRQRGRMYVANALHVVRHGTEGGPGTAFLLVYDFIGTATLYLITAMVGRRREEKLSFVAGMAGEMVGQLWLAIRKNLCGS